MATIASRVPWGTSRETPVLPVSVAILARSIRSKELREIRPVSLAKRGRTQEAEWEIPSVLPSSLRLSKRTSQRFGANKDLDSNEPDICLFRKKVFSSGGRLVLYIPEGQIYILVVSKRTKRGYFCRFSSISRCVHEPQ